MNSLQNVRLCCQFLLASIYMRAITCQTLSSTLLEGDRACPGVQITFTCTTSGSLVMAWRSDQYIGTNGAELEFTSADGVNSTMTSTTNPNTFATLVRASGNRVIETTLSIIVLDSFPTASVMCRDVGQGASIITFQPLALPGVPQNVTANKVALIPMDNCVIIVHWMPPNNAAESNITHYVIDSPFGSFITRNTSIEIALLVHHCAVETYIRIHATDYCNRNGSQTNDILTQLLITTNATSVPLTSTSGTTVTTEINEESSRSRQQNSNTAAIVGGVLGGFMGLTVIIVIALSIVVNKSLRIIGHLPKNQLEQALKGRLGSKDPSEPDGDSLSETKRCFKCSTKQKKKRYYVVRSKHLDEIDILPLTSVSDVSENRS